MKNRIFIGILKAVTGIGIFGIISFLTQATIAGIISTQCLSFIQKCYVVFFSTVAQTVFSLTAYDVLKKDFFGIEQYKLDPEKKPELPKKLVSIICYEPQNSFGHGIKRTLTIWFFGTTIGVLIDRKDKPSTFPGIWTKSKTLLVLYPLIMLPWRMIYVWLITQICLFANFLAHYLEHLGVFILTC